MRNEFPQKENSFPVLSQTVEYSLFFVAIFSLSQAAPLVRLAQAPAEVIGFWRLMGASLIMLSFCWWKEGRLFPHREVSSETNLTSTNLASTHSRLMNMWKLRWDDYQGWTVLSGVLFFLHLWTYFLAAQNTKIASLMVIFASNPLFTAFLSKFFLKDKFLPRYGIAYFFGFLSLAILFSDSFFPYLLTANSVADSISSVAIATSSTIPNAAGPSAASVSSHLNVANSGFGNIMALLSAIGYSGYIFTGKKSRSYIANAHYTWMIYLICGLCFGAVALIKGSNFTSYPLGSWLAILGTILVPTLMGHASFSFLLGRLNINWMSCGKLVEPVFSSITAWLIFGEVLQLKNYLSFILTFLSVLILIAPWTKRST